jgi:hypothetical protein
VLTGISWYSQEPAGEVDIMEATADRCPVTWPGGVGGGEHRLVRDRLRLKREAVEHMMEEVRRDLARGVEGVREVKTQQVEIPPIPPFVA